jgi:hypothetical protein
MKADNESSSGMEQKMTLTGKSIRALLATLLLLASIGARANLIASVDRDRISLGDTLVLTITATDNERLENINLNPLTDDFQILQRSSSSSTSIINGRRTSIRQVIIDLVARWEGTIRIPPLTAGPDTSNYLLISVGPAQVAPGEEITLIFDAELDKNSVYVQGQAILTLRIQQAVNLESRSVTELQLDSAFVKQLEQQSFQRTIDGRPWLIHEIRYAIFPEASGTLEIPAQTFSARESGGRRGMLSMGGGRKLQRTTQALSLRVLPIPASFKGATWLPAERLTIEEVWSTPPDQLQVGESATRTIKVIAQGLQAAQLPPIDFPLIGGLKTYPDQAVTQDIESATTVSGSREDSVALIPTQAGQWTVPEVSIPWWDVNSKTLRYALLPSREIVVRGGANTVADSFPNPLRNDIRVPIAVTPVSPLVAQTNKLWQYTAISFALAWLLTIAYVFYSKFKAPAIAPEGDSPRRLSENRYFKRLIAACGTQDSNAIRIALIYWTQSLSEKNSVYSLDGVAAFFQNSELNDCIKSLNATLYGAGDDSWKVEPLTDLLPRLRKTSQASSNHTKAILQLYPR